MTIEERAKKYARIIRRLHARCGTGSNALEYELESLLRLQDAESRQAQRRACAEAVHESLRALEDQDKCFPCDVCAVDAAIYVARKACLNAEEKE